MRRKNLDERVVESQRKVNSTACSILLWGILIILLYRQLYLGQEFKDYADIFIVWLVACAYVALGSVLRGIKPFCGKRIGLLVVPLLWRLLFWASTRTTA